LTEFSTVVIIVLMPPQSYLTAVIE